MLPKFPIYFRGASFLVGVLASEGAFPCFGANLADRTTITIEPKISHRAQRTRSAGSGSHSVSLRARIATRKNGSSNHRYHGAPHRLSTCRNQPTTESPSIPLANKAAKVTLFPRQARQNQENPERGFTPRIQDAQRNHVKSIAASNSGSGSMFPRTAIL